MTKFEDLFKVNRIIVPSYQRAYSWEEKQLDQFVSDLLEIQDKGNYYYGHFILEVKQNENEFEVIDGQQRFTTFTLFLMVCNLFENNEKWREYIDKFKTVDYDNETFEIIKANLKSKDTDWTLEDFELDEENQTLSVKRILIALNYFKNAFVKNTLLQSEISNYINTFLTAHISTHRTGDKAVAVQIFELQNTRGINLNLIEKVKSKLMKVIYLSSAKEEQQSKIKLIQDKFSEIYKIEEQAKENSFKGELLLEEILLYHLRVVDDGSKLILPKIEEFYSPSTNNREISIMKYLEKKIKDKEAKSQDDVVNYIINLVSKFTESVLFVSKILTDLDNRNKLIGDVMILNKSLSIQFFLLIRHKFEIAFSVFFQNIENIFLWEKLLFTRDFHDKYYRLEGRDRFEELFLRVVKEEEICEITYILNHYIEKGFRPDKMNNGLLQETVKEYIAIHKSGFLNNAFHFWNERMVYVLYKFEIKKGTDISNLRKIFKEGRSVEHILPQNWQWNWINIIDSQEKEKFNSNTQRVINGLGNLLLISQSENSSVSNKHPKEKQYTSCSGGSYTEHNETRKEKWEDFRKWDSNISERGENIFKFMLDYFQLNPNQ